MELWPAQGTSLSLVRHTVHIVDSFPRHHCPLPAEVKVFMLHFYRYFFWLIPPFTNPTFVCMWTKHKVYFKSSILYDCKRHPV